MKDLEQFATDAELLYLRAFIQYGSLGKSAKAIGVHKATVGHALARLKKRAALQGWSPDNDMTKIAPPGFTVKGTSTLYDDTGAMKVQWVKTHQSEEDRLLMALEAVKTAFAPSNQKVPKIPPPRKSLSKDLLVVYPMGDPHIGMYAWAQESGADFDVAIAERNLVTATTRLVACAPDSDQALIVNVGDFYHSDSMDNRTSRSGHALDVDTRWAKVLHIGVRAMRACIEAALVKHKTVRVINEIGNHDDHTAQVLTLALSMAYENNPRVSFDDSPATYHYYQFGDNLIGVTHGDKGKPEELGCVMAADRPKEWGETQYRYWYTGHIHNRKVFDLPGVMVESFRTLAPKDAWTASMGYRTGRDMYALTLHRRYGEIERYRVDIRQLEDDQ